MTTKEVKIEGRIKKLFQKQQVTEKFAKREVWIEETEGQYPNNFSIEFHNDNCAKLDSFKEGDIVSIDINLRGKFWSKDTREGVMNTFVGWKVTKLSEGDATGNYTSMNDIDDEPLF